MLLSEHSACSIQHSAFSILSQVVAQELQALLQSLTDRENLYKSLIATNTKCQQTLFFQDFFPEKLKSKKIVTLY